ncbi:VOC family protein [Mucilaginibacter jinjuensis]|uniref:VOC family protein n=1 Tax=Mucilaginibacter jinjuensis TaxID=1176721 RepID=A0ABY7T8Y6_9SPHI|nr:VOC family protein [Mucilaginibacter jinjuensis]WCT12886.1 VOC family protein [Mucilaginibacter jinjuensis]
MLNTSPLHAFIPTLNPTRAKEFYGETLGLTQVSESPFALEFDANGTLLRVTTVQALIPHPFTVLGWGVNNIEDMIVKMTAKGIYFEIFGFFEQDDLGIWLAPDGTKVAWFKDPDGNLLSLAESKK